MTSEFAIAVHALVYLNHKQSIVPSDSLAKNVCTNPARIRKVMAKLKKAGLVATKEGMEGGYYFEKQAGEMNLKQISDALAQPMVTAGWKSGNKDLPCVIASGMGDIMDEIYEKLNDACQEKLQGITIQMIESRIFHGIHTSHVCK